MAAVPDEVPNHDEKSAKPAHTPGTTRGEQVGAAFQEGLPNESDDDSDAARKEAAKRSDAAGGSRVDTQGSAGS